MNQEVTANFVATGKAFMFEKDTRVPVLVGIIARHGAERDAFAFVVDISEPCAAARNVTVALSRTRTKAFACPTAIPMLPTATRA